MLARFHQTLRALAGELGNPGVALDVAVVRTGDDLGFWM